MNPLFDIKRLEVFVENNYTVLTSNSRLAEKISQAFALSTVGVDSIMAPKVSALNTWIESKWCAAQDMGFDWALPICSQSQMKQLFHRALKESDFDQDIVMGVTLLSGFAEGAYRSLYSAGLTLSDIPFDDLRSEHLKKWCTRVDEYLSVMRMTSQEKAVGLLAQSYPWAAGEKVVLVGFDNLSAIHRKLLNAAFGAGVEALDDSPVSCGAVRVECFDKEDEIVACASWAFDRLLEDPEARIGIIDPNLGSTRNKIEKQMTRQFECHYFNPTTSRYVVPFNFSAGTPLGLCPIVYDALELLSLPYEDWEMGRLKNILNSPFWGGRSESRSFERLNVERVLVNLERHSIKGKSLFGILSSDKLAISEEGDVILLARYLGSFAGKNLSYEVKFPSEWSAIFILELTGLCWGGLREQDSVEFQQASQLYASLEEFCALDNVGVTFTRVQALTHLRQVLVGTPFQAKTIDSPIQIMGSLEGSGLLFDHVWILGMNQNSWPPAAEPNPLLPVVMQVEYDMPRCDPARELALAKSLTERFKACGRREVVFSSCLHDSDGNEMLVSRIISDIPKCSSGGEVGNSVDQQISTFRKFALTNFQLTEVDDTYGMPLPAENAKGGSVVLKDQAGCPFDSYVNHRLGARPDRTPVSGIPPTFRGNLIHDVLGSLWGAWGGSAVPKSLSEDARDEQIMSAINDVCAKKVGLRPDVLTPRFLGIEKKRVFNHIRRLINLELERPEFKVLSVEEAYSCKIGSLTLNLRLDRKDQIASGEVLVVDFKTGKSSEPSNWIGPRAEDPQLPLYAITDSSAPKGILFANCNTKKISLAGLGDSLVAHSGIEDITNPSGKARWATNLPRSWPEMIDEWKFNLGNIADEYSNGFAKVSYSSVQVMQRSSAYFPLNRFNSVDQNDI